MSQRILLVEDSKELSLIMQAYLEDKGLTVTLAESIDSAVEALTTKAFDLMILDINLPDGDGLGFLEDFRRDSNLPVIFASARSSETDRVEGFVRGGDDYISKPFSLEELYMRVSALLRRSSPSTDAVITLGNFVLDKNTELIKHYDETLNLSPKEYSLLAYMLERPNTLLTKDELLQAVWGTYSEVEPSTLTVHIRWLREKIEDNPAEAKIITTVWGKGYQFNYEAEDN